jgi:S-DNA-T family DNA segregation ATPase FtsK/SpoIIIE
MHARERGIEHEDELYEDAVRVILQTGRGSVSLLQRRLSIGYSRAARLVDMMAEAGVVGPHKGSQPRDLLMTLEEWEDAHARQT